MPSLGYGVTSRRGTPCSTRTTCPTTTLRAHHFGAVAIRTTWEQPAMSELGVIFGGPSPEHDVSVLTGLQAARELVSSAGLEVRGLYWAKSGDWFEVAPTLEAGDFVEGVPASAVPLRLSVGPAGGFVPEGKRLGRSRPFELEVAVVCCHGGPGEDGSLQAVLDLSSIRYTGPSVSAAAIGMDKLAFYALMVSAGLPVLPR